MKDEDERARKRVREKIGPDIGNRGFEFKRIVFKTTNKNVSEKVGWHN